MDKRKIQDFFRKPDPFMEFLQGKKPFNIWLVSTTFLVTFWLITGGFVELLHLYHPSFANLNFMHLYELSEFSMALSLYAFFYPLIFVLYVLIPNQLVKTVSKLEKGDILDKDDNGQFLSVLLEESWYNKIIYPISLIGSLLFIVFYELIFFRWQSSMGLYAYWHVIPWMKVLFYLFYGLMSFSAFILAIRVVVMAARTAKFFKQEKKILDLKPLHPDKCGGMGPLGNLGLCKDFSVN